MNCDWVQQNITLYLYNELADDAQHEVQQHLVRCPAAPPSFPRSSNFKAL